MSLIYRFLIAAVLVFCLFSTSHAQQARIVFYNVENLFDTRDDSLTNDAEFLPSGAKNWTYARFYRKLVRIYQTLVALGEGEMPAVIGLCEIENRGVLEKLIHDTPLNSLNYRIIHRESNDARGIDVALLYRPDIFSPDSAEWLKVPLAAHESTREILHVTGRLWKSDSIHFYVNHWPSRYGGAGSSGVKRLAAASTLAASVKEVLITSKNSNIVMMGDFNDEPGDESLQAINKILKNYSNDERFRMINLSEKKSFAVLEGTIKHQGVWCIFDHIIVSTGLASGLNGIRLVSDETEIFSADFLLEPDDTYTGHKPFRTYAGPGYHNGFSDHLPVSIRIEKNDGTD